MSLANVQAVYKLTPVQQGMLLATLASPASGIYCDQFTFGGGAVDHAAFREAWRRVFARHPALRTSFLWQGVEEPVQLVHRTVEDCLRFEDWRGLPAAEQHARLAALTAADREQGFDLTAAPVMRLTVVQMDEAKHEIIWSYHHLLLDAWSVGLLLREAELTYDSIVRASELELPAARPFRLYVEWQRAQDPAAARAYWQRQLADITAPTPLPFDRAPGSAPGPRARFRSDEIALPPVVSERLRELARRERLSINLLVEGAWALLLGRLAGARTVVFGVTVSGRPPEVPGIDQMVGCLINTLPVRAGLDAGEPFVDLVRRLQASLLELRRFEYSPLAEVETAAAIPGREPLFGSVLVSNTFTADRNYQSFQRTNFPLALTITPRPEGVVLALGYDRGRFASVDMRRLLALLGELLTQVAVAGAGVRQGELALLPRAEHHRTLCEWNDTATTFGAPPTLTAALARQLRATPEAIAVEAGDGALSYRALGGAARALALRLRAKGAGPEAIVGVAAERSLELEVALLAVLEAGAAYLPLDPSYPAERLAFMLEDAAVCALVADERSLARLPALAAPVIALEGVIAAAPVDDAAICPELAPENAAYVIFTSGSTGRPKGAVNRHAGIVNRLAWMQAAYPLSGADVVLQKTPISFDVSVWELFWPLMVGARLVMLEPEGHRDPRALARALTERAVTALHFVPSMLAAFLEEEPAPGSFPALRQVMASGEALPVALAERAERALGAPLFNLYGPTEAAVDVTAFPARDSGAESTVPIGRPIANTQILILGPTLAPQPAGIAGELAIGGENLGRGYHRRPAQTAARWVPAPAAAPPGARVYLTGDLARQRADGTLEFLGRLDHQVKVRGLRIELGEIEAALLRHPAVREAVVVARGESLAAYLVGRGDEVAGSELRAHLAAKLPEHMVPGTFVWLEALPLSPNGKLDRRALPAPELGTEGVRRPPSTPAEELLLTIWEEILGRGGISTDDNFFAVGGHSLLAARLAARIRDAFEVELPLPAVLAAPTLSALANDIAAVRAGGGGEVPVLPALAPGEEAPLSFAEERMWFLDRLAPGSPLYTIPAAVELEGELHPAAVWAAFAGLAARHQVLRTRYPAPDGRPRRELAPAAPLPLPTVDLGRLPAARAGALARELAARQTRRPFDLERGPLLRLCLLRSGPRAHLLALAVHHIAADGWSLGVLVQDFATLYRRALDPASPPPPPLPFSVAQVAAWQRGAAGRAALERDLAYWRGALEGAPGLLTLPTDRPRPAVAGYRGAVVWRLLSPAQNAALEGLGRAQRATLFMTLLAAWQLLLARHSGAADLLVGAPVAGRDRRELEGLVGLFVNTLALRARLEPGLRFQDHLRRTRRAVLDAFAHAGLPFEKLIEELAPERSLAHAPLVQVLLVLQNAPLPELALPGLTARLSQVETGTAKFDLSLSVAATEGGLACTLEYDRDLFDRTTALRLLGQLEALLAAAAAAPEAIAAALPLLGAAERQQALAEWNDSAGTWPESPPLLHHGVRRQCRATPDAIALAAGDGALSYAALAVAAARLAARLRGLGVGPEATAAVLLERSLELPVALLAVLEAGGAYLPLDPESPAERLASILEEAAAAVVITCRALAASLPAPRAAVLELDDDAFPAPVNGLAPPAPAALSPAYVIYTSGTTGRPKGVVNHHAGIVNRLAWMQATYGLGAGDRVLQKTPMTFDVSVWEFFWPLLTGARLELAPPGVHREPAALARTFAERAITLAHFVPSMLAAFLDSAGDSGPLPHLRQLVASGEALPWELAERAVTKLGVPLDNLYGPTEAAVDVTRAPFRPGAPRASVAIGRPITNLAIRLLEPAGQPVPIGVGGELAIGGIGLARGYLGRPAQTAERFVPDPFASGAAAGARLYRTGDLARALADGNIEFLGRLDQQVKIRGLRIELGEIESVLSALPAVEECAVVAHGASTGPVLVAYVVPRGGAPLAVPELRRALARKLPVYMVPALFVALEALPLSANGKLDRKALPAPQWSPASASAERPLSPTEELVAGVFAEVLGRERVPADASFFELGGHSLLAAQVVARLGRTLGVEPPLARLFAAPTASALAAEVEALRRAGVGTAEPPLTPRPVGAEIPLSFAQERLWFLSELQPASAAFNLHGALALEGALAVQHLAAALNALVSRHEALRTTFPARDGRPRQEVVAARLQALPVIDLAALPTAAGRAHREQLARATAARPFDLARGPLLCTVLARLGAEQHALLLALHHIVGDGWSLGVLTRDLGALYQARCEGRADALPPLPVQPADVAFSQRARQRDEMVASAVDFWRGELASAPPLLALPSDRPRPPAPSFRGAEHRLELPPDLAAALQRLARAEGATLFMVLLAAGASHFGRLAQRTDLVLGTPSAGRRRTETEGLIGFFVQSLPLRLRLAGVADARGVIARAREVTLRAFEQSEIPFDKLVEELAPERTLAHAPIFQVMLVLQNTPQAKLELPGLTFQRLPSSSGSVQFDLVLSFEETDRGLSVNFDYATDLFDRTTIVRWAASLWRLLAAVAAEPALPLAALPHLSAAEEQQLLREWAGRGEALPAGTCTHHLVAAVAAERPETVALAMADEALSYGALEAWAGALAGALHRRGIGLEERVAVCVERSPAAVAGLLAVMKAGAAYLPLDPAYPAERLRFMLADGGVRLVLAQPWFAGAFAEHGLPELPLAPAPAGTPFAHPEVGPEHLAYLIYTSGSTGNPKGVLVPHRGLTNMCLDLALAWRLAPGDVHLTFNSLAFDASASNLYPVLATGATFLLHPSPGDLTGAELERFVEERAVTHLDVPPAFWALWLPELTARRERPLLPSLCQLNLGGDSASLPLVRQWAAATEGRVTIFGPYGPTETTVGSSYHLTRDGSELAAGATKLPLGRPFLNTALTITDRELRLLPLGAAGEITISGVGLARGYLAAPGQTALRFVPNPFAAEPGARLYRTGDLGRLTAEGRVEFLGRVDAQVKVRGFRIEPGEIEAALAAHPRIAKAVVLAREVGAGKGLVAYVVAEGEPSPPAAELRAFLAERLPAYMLPTAFVPLAELPLGPTGKVDRAALPAPTAAALLEGEIVAPRSALEASLAAIFAELLGRERVSVEASFFELGGHSLLATQAVSRIRAALGRELALATLFEAPTVAALALALGDGAAPHAPLPPIPRRPRRFEAGVARLPVSFNQQRLWFLDQLEPGSPRYNVPAALRLAGALVPRQLTAALGTLIRRHETLRTRFGWSGGEPEQLVSAAAATPLPVVDLSDLPAGVRVTLGPALAGREALRPFDLARGPLLRTRLFRLAPEEHLLAITLHHAIGDGWSLGVLIGELAAAYAAAVAGREPSLPVLPVQYGDYAAWQREVLAGERLAAELAFWRAELTGAPTALDLPTDRPRPEVLTARGAAQTLTLPAALVAALRTRAGAQGATLFMALVAAWQVLLARLCRTDEVLVGIGVANRGRLELEPLIGFFVNTLVLRAALGGNPTLEAAVEQARARSLTAFAHEEMPFDKLVEELKLPRDLTRMPLVQAAFVLQNAPLPAPRLGELELTPVELGTTTAKFDLLLALVERGDEAFGSLEFNTDLFDAATIDRFLELYCEVLTTYAERPSARLSEVPLFRRELAQNLGLEERAVRRFAPLSPVQRDLYLDHLRDPAATTYSLGLSLPLGRGLDAALWQRASDLVLAREEAAALCITALRGEPYAVIDPPHAAPTERIVLGVAGAPASLEEVLAARVKVPYDLARDPLFRSFLLVHPDGESTALLAVEHAAADAFSGKVFFERVARAYRALAAGGAPAEEPPSFLAAVPELLARFDRPETLAHFERALAAVSPLEVQPPRGRAPRPVVERAELAGAELAELRAVAAALDLRLPALFRAALALLAARLFEPDADLALAEILGGRGAEDRETVGPFFHQLPLLVPHRLLRPQAHLRELFAWAAGYRRELGGKEALSVLAARRLGAGRGLTFVLNVYNFTRVAGPLGPGTLAVHDSFPRDEVHLLASDEGDRLVLSWCFDATALAVARLAERFRALLGRLGRLERAGEVPILLADEREQVLFGWNATARSYGDSQSLLPAIAERLAARPEAIAVAFGEEQLSAAAVGERSQALAQALGRAGAGRGTVLALALERSAELPVAILGAVRAGAAYLPLDPTYPEERLRFLLADAGAAAIVATSRWQPLFAGAGLPLLVLDGEALPAANGGAPLDQAAGEELAYVIYTSGSTGAPKGAMNTHAALANRILWMQEAYGLAPEDRVLQKTPTTFDVSVWEFFWPLLTGARLVLARPEGHKDPAYLAALIAERRITALHFVPSMLAVFLAGRETAGLTSLRLVFASGEALAPEQVAGFAALSEAALHNLYGPTEAAIDVSFWETRGVAETGLVPIGRPIANLRLYVLGKAGLPLPVGVQGELAIAGAGLARGYLGRPALTAERFVPDAFAPTPGERRYRTGDLARFLPDGSLEYRGRLDHQVKVRGVRIELGEVEAALTSLPEVAAAVVTVLDAGTEAARLAAYVVAARAEAAPAPEELRRALARRLPDALVPSIFVPLLSLPLTPSGKVDRRALPAPERSRSDLERSYTAPATELEKTLATLWRSALGREQVGIHDSFFDLGGHSLLLARVQADLGSRLGHEVSMVELFQYPTIASLAKHLEGKARPAAPDRGRRQRAAERARQRQGAAAAGSGRARTT